MNPVLPTQCSLLPAPAASPRVLLVALHGIMTSQTDPSWPDHLDAHAFRHHPEVKVLKKEYIAGPFPRLNALKNRRLAAGLANEIELFLASRPAQESDHISKASPKEFEAVQRRETPIRERFEFIGNPHAICPSQEAPREFEAVQGREIPIRERFEFFGQPRSQFSPPIWFVAHSNGALIALLVTKRLIEHGHWIGGVILTGAACEADVRKNRVLGWLQSGRLGFAAAYCSETDHVLPPGQGGLKAWLWRRLVWPYGSLGRTGWLGVEGERDAGDSSPHLMGGRLVTRWFNGGHSTYFNSVNRDRTFEQIFADIAAAFAERRFSIGLRPQSTGGGLRMLNRLNCSTELPTENDHRVKPIGNRRSVHATASSQP